MVNIILDQKLIETRIKNQGNWFGMPGAQSQALGDMDAGETRRNHLNIIGSRYSDSPASV